MLGLDVSPYLLFSPSTYPWIVHIQAAEQAISCHHSHILSKSSCLYPYISPLITSTFLQADTQSSTISYSRCPNHLNLSRFTVINYSWSQSNWLLQQHHELMKSIGIGQVPEWGTSSSSSFYRPFSSKINQGYGRLLPNSIRRPSFSHHKAVVYPWEYWNKVASSSHGETTAWRGLIE